jgi:hypothetical protein
MPTKETITIGTAKGGPVRMDTLGIVDNRLLGCANSGGGKSYMLRGLIEQAAQHVPTIVLDPEGEFATLREKLDMVLVGPDGEVPADPRAAKLLARKLAELRLSAVIDLSDLSLTDRRRFVRLFLDSLLSIPRKLWAPRLVVLDEAHKFAPERSAGQAESTDAVISLMAQGRKRGLGGCLVTQRLSKLHKDAVGECNNVLLGRCVQDVDLRRAGDILGFAAKDRAVLRTLKAGEFFGFGPAFLGDGGIVRFRTRKVTTTHPDSRSRHKLKTPAPSAKILKVLPELADLAAKEEAEVQTVDTLRKRNTEQEATIAALMRKVAAEQPPEIDQGAIDSAVDEAVRETVRSRDRQWGEAWKERAAQFWAGLTPVRQALEAVPHIVAPIPIKRSAPRRRKGGRPVDPSVCPYCDEAPHEPGEGCPTLLERPPLRRVSMTAATLKGGAKRRIMVALAQYPDGLTRDRIAALTGLKNGGNTIGDLRKAGHLEDLGAGALRATTEGIAAVGAFKLLPAPGAQLVQWWSNQLGQGLVRGIFNVVTDRYPASIERDELAGMAGVTASGGHFGNCLGELRKKGLITGSGSLRASEDLYP